MPYINLDDCIEVDVDVEVTDITVSASSAYFDIEVDDIDGLDDHIKDEVRTQLNESHEVVDAKAVAVEILRMLADILQQS